MRAASAGTHISGLNDPASVDSCPPSQRRPFVAASHGRCRPLVERVSTVTDETVSSPFLNLRDILFQVVRSSRGDFHPTAAGRTGAVYAAKTSTVVLLHPA